MEYLVIISLVLHLVSFLIIIVLYQRMESQKPINQEKAIKEMEDLLVSYTTEMKENNERLARRIAKLSTTDHIQKDSIQTVSSQNKNERVASLQNLTGKKPLNYNKPTPPISYEKKLHPIKSEESYDKYEPPTPTEEEKVVVDSSNTSRILSLNAMGYSVSEIAKELQMGAGEVELLLKFYK